MNEGLNLERYERRTIDDSLRSTMKENERIGSETRDELTKMYYQDINVTLFKLRSKIQSADSDSGKYEDLSLSDLKLVKSSLLILDESNYQNSLVEKDKIEYYKNCKLQISTLLEKLNVIEQYTMYNGLL